MSRFLSMNSEVKGKGYILGKLYKISWFPGAILSDLEENKVFGTLFKLKNVNPTFKVLDAYEGFDTQNVESSLFKREITTAFLENKTTINTWVYIYNQPVENSERILSGNFLT